MSVAVIPAGPKHRVGRRPDAGFVRGAGWQQRGLTAWWALGSSGGASGTAYDLSGNGDDGTLTGIVARSGTPEAGSALELDGAASHVALSGAGVTGGNFANPWSIVTWARWNGSGSVAFVTYSEGNTASNTQLFALAMNAATLRARCVLRGNNNINLSFDGTDPVTANKWHHYALTHDGTTTTLWLDGRAQGTANPVSIITLNVRHLGRLQRTTDGAWWPGDLGDCRLYGRALSAAEVRALYDPRTRWSLYQRPFRMPVGFGTAAAPAAIVTTVEAITVRMPSVHALTVRMPDADESTVRMPDAHTDTLTLKM